jgi:folylpolyglutamate synthase/dihydropteroate synthase
VLIFSCLRDKPVTEMAQILFPLFDRVIFAPIHSPRATPMEDMLSAAEATGTKVQAAASVEEALGLAQQAVAGPEGRSEIASSFGPAEAVPLLQGHAEESLSTSEVSRAGSLVVVSGSVYLVGEVRALLTHGAAR